MADLFGDVTSSSRIPIFDSEDEVEAISCKFLSDKPEAYIVYEGTDEYRDENNVDKINSVVRCVVILYYRVQDDHGQENSRVQDEITLKNSVLNAILTDRTRGGHAHHLVADGEGVWGTEVGPVEVDRARDPFYKLRIQVRCAFQHTDTGR